MPCGSGPQPELGVVPLDEERAATGRRRAATADGDEAHPPRRCSRRRTRRCSQGVDRRLPASEVVVVHGRAAAGRPAELPAAAPLARRRAAPSARTCENMCPPTTVGLRARSREGHGAGDALGLGDDVVVEEQDVVAAPAVEGLEHGAGEAPGPAEVGLLDDPQPVPEQPVGVGEARVVGDLRVPWSTTRTASTTSSSSSGRCRAGRAGPVQYSGRLNVVIPMVTPAGWRPSATASRAGTHQSASSSDEAGRAGDEVEPDHPPSTKLVQGQGHLVRRRSVEPAAGDPGRRRPAPTNGRRRRSPAPVVRSRRVTSRTVVNRRQ